MPSPGVPHIGQIAKVIQGRDAGLLTVIIAVEDQRFVWIADGKKRKFDQPKKKNLIHLELLPVISPEVADSLKQTGRVTNGKLRFALKLAADECLKEAQEKGE